MLENLNEQIEEIKALANLGKTNFPYSSEQLLSIGKIIKFCNSKPIKYNQEHAMSCLTGSAGSGKTKVLSQVISYLTNNNYDFAVCAPTHKAKTIIEGYFGTKTFTLHELLKLHPNLNIMELDLKTLKFESKKNKLYLPRIVIIDECSMINNDMFQYILEEIVQKNKSKVLFCGDEKQIRPVNYHTTSPTFHIPNKLCLTKVFRQNQSSILIDILTELRDKPIYKFDTKKSLSGSLFTTNDIKKFVLSASKEFFSALKEKNVYKTKIACYTNQRVDFYNLNIRQAIFGSTPKEYYAGEILTAFDSFKGAELIAEGSEFDKSRDIKLYNSLDYRVLKVSEINRQKDDLIPFEIPGHYLLLEDSITKDVLLIFILSRNCSEQVKYKLCNLIENIRMKAVSCKKNGRPKQAAIMWKKYFDIQDKIATPFDLYFDNRLIKKATLKYGYAQTSHKLQGSSYDNIYIDMQDILRCSNKEELRQLQYVALSRTRSDVKMLIN